jgi:protein phosphatase
MNNSAPCPTFELEYAHASDMGMRRMNNQDSVAVMVTSDPATWAARGHLMMVADGMGAHAAGELASKLAVDNIPHTYFKLRDLYPPAALRQAIRDANRVIHTKGQSSIGFQGMGTTCSCLVLLPQGALVAHVGDSRVYRLRGNVLEQLTSDHSLVWEMAAAGQIPEAEVPAYIPKNVITRSLGPHPTVNIDLEGPYEAAAGDVFLVCSDGLSGQINDEELGEILACLAPGEAVQTLVDIANLRGGPDNISIIAARVAGNSPATEGEAHRPQPMPLVRPAHRRWAAAGLGLILAPVLAYFVVHQMWFGATATGILALILVAAWSYRAGAAAGKSDGSIVGPYGNGPYRKNDCQPSRPVVDALADIAARLRELADKQPDNWDVQWRTFDELRSLAAAATNAGQLADAIRHYCHAVRDVMRQLRGQRPTIDDSSGFGPPNKT